MRNISYLAIAYQGLRYHGFQTQPGFETVENCIISSLRRIGCFDDFSMNTYSHGGRTDRGVSALGQIISFSPVNGCSPEQVAVAINEQCPEVIVWGYREDLPPQFKVRYWALWREYIYIDEISRYKSSIESLQKALGWVKNMRSLAPFYKDFKLESFSPWYFSRRILDAEIKRIGEKLTIRIRGESFTYHFVRRLISFLRAYDENSSPEENLRNWRGGQAEPERLILSRVMTPYAHRALAHIEKVATGIVSSLPWCPSSLCSSRIFLEILLRSWDP